MSDVGKYRVRKGWFKKSILQKCHDGPAFLGGQVDASIRVHYWSDVDYNQAPSLLEKTKG